MLKRILYPLLQFAAFLTLMFFGGNWDTINLQHELVQMQRGISPTPIMTTIKFPVGNHILIAQGILFTTVLLVVVLLVEALRKKLKPWALLSLASYVLAVVVGLALKMGLPPSN